MNVTSLFERYLWSKWSYVSLQKRNFGPEEFVVNLWSSLSLNTRIYDGRMRIERAMGRWQWKQSLRNWITGIPPKNISLNLYAVIIRQLCVGTYKWLNLQIWEGIPTALQMIPDRVNLSLFTLSVIVLRKWMLVFPYYRYLLFNSRARFRI